MQIHSTFDWVQVTVIYIVFYYIVILTCTNDFIFLFVKSQLYIICALNAKIRILPFQVTVEPSQKKLILLDFIIFTNPSARTGFDTRLIF